MKKTYRLIGLLLIMFSLVACAGADEEAGVVEDPETEVEAAEPAEETNEIEEAEDIEEEVEEIEQVKEFEPLADQEVEKIVIDNLDRMSASQDEYDYQAMMGIVNDSIIDPAQDTDEVTKVLEATKEQFKRLVADEILDEWTRSYLADFYWTMSIQHLHSGDISARFEVLEQSDDHFTASFIRMADGAGYYPAGTYQLDYVKENGFWVFLDVNFTSAEEKPLNITMNEVREHYRRYDTNDAEVLSFFEPVEEVVEDGENYLVYKAHNYIHARDVVDSEYNFEVAMPYNIED